MTETRQNWSLGIDNRSDLRRVPTGAPYRGQAQPGALREAINVDANADGSMSLRAGYQRIYAGTGVRGALALGQKVLIADGADLVELDLPSGAHQVVRQIPASGVFAGAELNGELFFCTSSETLRYDGRTVRPWGVPTVTMQPLPSVVAGGLAPGNYLCACTLVNAQGEEGGTVQALTITLEQPGGLAFQLPAAPVGGSMRVYVGPASSGTLYLQGEATGTVTVTTLRDDTARLETLGMSAPLIGQAIVAYNSVLMTVNGSTLSYTKPFRAHLRSALDVFQFGDVIDLVMPVADETAAGLFVAAGERTYYLSSLETDAVSQAQPLLYGAVPGTGVRLPSGGATWMTRFGQLVASPGGVTKILTEHFAPEPAVSGAAGVLEHNGQQLVVATVRGSPQPGGLAAGDYYVSEIITHE
ncbi:hypothetical protein SB18R_03280 [Pseudomonas oryzihabitans]|nr:hypothetical protein SB9_12515 [Pseudomonas psychrotolerans]KTT78266.1 hypothetical protein SB18R_03280 [Pseudomonas psychrotolerans]